MLLPTSIVLLAPTKTLPNVALPVRPVAPVTVKIPVTFAFSVWKLAYEATEIVVFEMPVVVKAVINCCEDSCQTKAMLFEVPRCPINPMSTAGAPVCCAANSINGSSTIKLTVSIVVVFP